MTQNHEIVLTLQNGKLRARCDTTDCVLTNTSIVLHLSLDNISLHFVDLHRNVMRGSTAEFPQRLHFTSVSLGLGAHKSSVTLMSQSLMTSSRSSNVYNFPNCQLPWIAKILRVGKVHRLLSLINCSLALSVHWKS